MPKTAGIIIIGDEILSGKTKDDNSFFMVQELWSHGIYLRRISIIPDVIDEIAEVVKNFSEKFDYVFTSGGIGPTHDDVTIEGISKAFGVKPMIHETLKEFLKRKQAELSPEQLKMAEVPEGAELINDSTIGFPLIKFRNIFIFPGIPQLLKKKFFVIEKSFHEPRIYLKKIYVKESEPMIAPVLNEIVKTYTNVKIGSYPVMDNTEYTVKITLESQDELCLNTAVENLLLKIAKEKLVRVAE
ncbi:MAG: competence/damage-inducible protein A [Nitrospirae bacterium]|jgi:molybdenum cofactor synthesis domain-containing protein|nr:competence/damage-inducible protein A [Nitrospirota bacterium]